MTQPAPRKVKGIWTNKRALITAMNGIQHGLTDEQIIQKIHARHYASKKQGAYTLDEVRQLVPQNTGLAG